MLAFQSVEAPQSWAIIVFSYDVFYFRNFRILHGQQISFISRRIRSSSPPTDFQKTTLFLPSNIPQYISLLTAPAQSPLFYA